MSAPVRGETVAKLKVAINGFGRIGRNFLRCWHGRKDSPLDVIVVNDSAGVKNVSRNRDRFFLGLCVPRCSLTGKFACECRQLTC